MNSQYLYSAPSLNTTPSTPSLHHPVTIRTDSNSSSFTKGSPKNDNKHTDRKGKDTGGTTENDKEDDYNQEMEAFDKLRQQYETIRSKSPQTNNSPPTIVPPPFSLSSYSQPPTYLLPTNSPIPLQYALVPQVVGLPSQSQLGPYVQYSSYPFIHGSPSHYPQNPIHQSPVDPLRAPAVRRSLTATSSLITSRS